MPARVFVTGNVGRDPDLRFTASGQASLDLSIGCTPRRKDRQSEQWEDDGAPLWITCTLWGEEAERLTEVLHQGTKISVSGTLRRRTYERRGGGQGEALELVGARDLAIIPKADKARTSAGSDWASQPQRTPPGRAQQADPWAATPVHDEPPF